MERLHGQPAADGISAASGRDAQVKHESPWSSAPRAPHIGAAILQPAIQRLLDENTASSCDVGASSQAAVWGSSGCRFSLKTLTWDDATVQQHESADVEAPRVPKLPWQGRPWYANYRPLAVPVVLAYVATCIAYVVIRARDSIRAISAPGYGWTVLAMEVAGMVSLLQAAINHLYKVDWTTQPFMGSQDPKYRVRVLVPCYKEDVEVLQHTLLRATKALHVGASAIAEGHVYLCDDAPATAAPASGKTTYRAERAAMMGIGSDAEPSAMRDAARGDPSSLLFRRVTMHYQPRHREEGPVHEGLVNNKAQNINHCVRSIANDWHTMTGSTFNEDGCEIFAVLDADQAIVDKVADAETLSDAVEPALWPRSSLAFFKDLLPWFIPDKRVAIVQTPQVFRGCLLGSDILNHRNIDFWTHQQPAYNLRNFISCAGTNFLIRASAFMEAGSFPEHTLTEDFALGQELMRRGHRGVYVEKAYVLGEAPDVLRVAMGQRSRWCKGAFQMLVSLRGMRSLFGLRSPRLIWMYTFPCYNYVVSGLCTPLFMAVPVVFVWAGAFPALLAKKVIGIAAAYFCITIIIQYFPRLDRPSLFRDVLAHWNADVATKNFWFMYLKAALRGPLPHCNEGVSRWKSGSDKNNDGWRDVLPHAAFLFAYVFTIAWATTQVCVGVSFRGPMGISLLWCLYQGIPPFLLLLHRCMRLRHQAAIHEDTSSKATKRAKQAWRRRHATFAMVNMTALLASAALALSILSLAVSTASNKADLATVYSGSDSTGYMSPAEVVRTLRTGSPPPRFADKR